MGDEVATRQSCVRSFVFSATPSGPSLSGDLPPLPPAPTAATVLVVGRRAREPGPRRGQPPAPPAPAPPSVPLETAARPQDLPSPSWRSQLTAPARSALLNQQVERNWIDPALANLGVARSSIDPAFADPFVRIRSIDPGFADLPVTPTWIDRGFRRLTGSLRLRSQRRRGSAVDDGGAARAPRRPCGWRTRLRPMG